MNRIQKISWFIFINFTLAMILTVAVFLILLPKIGFDRALGALGVLGLCGISGFAPIFFKKDPGWVQCDERDRFINRRAAMFGFGSAYLFVGLVCMLPFEIMGADATIKVRWLPLIFGGAGIVNFYMHSIAILVQYGKDREGRDE